MTSHYVSNRYPTLKELGITDCYICGKSLHGDITSDHIIPDSFFKKGDPYRPQLPVHLKCNNTKSTDDRWCVKFLQFYAGFSDDAKHDLKTFIDKAMVEKPYAFTIGSKNPNYVLAKGLFEKMTPSTEVNNGSESYYQFKIAPDAGRRVSEWMKQLCRGLFIRNVLYTHPSDPKLTWNQLALSTLNGEEKKFIEPIERLINNSGATSFGQEWGTRMTYIGSRISETPDKGYVFMHFYGQVAVLAAFGVKSNASSNLKEKVVS